MIDWTNPEEKITEHFTVKEILTLHSWNRLATESDGVDFDKITKICQIMEKVREILSCPINVHCGFRSQEYNKEQDIHPNLDVHALSEAVDFDCNGYLTIQEVKDKLLPHLEDLNIRMEYGTFSWIHVDLHKVGPSGRYFHV